MERWSSRLGFVLAAIGSAVGIGNIWRFPAVAGQNGGGAYLVPYLVSFFLLATPLLAVELRTGRDLHADIVTAFRTARHGIEPLGWLVLAVVAVLLSYYLVITGWVLAFTGFYLTNTATTFQEFTSTPQPLAYFLASALLVGLMVSLGVKRGIERTAVYLVPLTFILLTLMAIYAATLQGFNEGAAFFLQPDFRVLTDPLVWGAAFGQAFFSLSAGMGVMTTFGSYLPENTPIRKSAVTIAAADFTVAVLAGLVIFPVVFTYGLQPTLGAELAFTTLPRAFNTMTYGNVFATTFFALLFFAAVTSAISMMELAVASITRRTNTSRRRATAALTVVVLLLGLPSALSYTSLELTLLGSPVLDVVDDTVGSLGLLVTALLISIAFTWVRPARTTESRLVKYALPPLLTAVIALTLLQITPPAALGYLTDIDTGRHAGELVIGASATIVLLLAYRFWNRA